MTRMLQQRQLPVHAYKGGGGARQGELPRAWRQRERCHLPMNYLKRKRRSSNQLLTMKFQQNIPMSIVCMERPAAARR